MHSILVSSHGGRHVGRTRARFVFRIHLVRVLMTLAAVFWGSAAIGAPPTDGAPVTPEPAPAVGAAPDAQVDGDSLVAEYSPEQGEPSDVDRAVVAGFEPALGPYGVWRQHPVYGRVWVPNQTAVGPDFEPYVTGGHWALTNQGEWIWVSDQPFGDIVYHYGRWVWAEESGWIWIPGWRYAPAWVVWRVPRRHYAYVGWAPMPPSYIWLGTELVWLDAPPPAAFVFCYSSYVFRPHPHRHVVRDRIALRRMLRETSHYRPEREGATLRRSPSASRAQVPTWAVPRERVAARPVASVPERAVSRLAAAAQKAAARRSAVARPHSTTAPPLDRADSVRARSSGHPATAGERLRGVERAAAALRESEHHRPSSKSRPRRPEPARSVEPRSARVRGSVAPSRPRAMPTPIRTAPQRRVAEPRAVRRSR